jgi:parallel beta-helix repeat protein
MTALVLTPFVALTLVSVAATSTIAVRRSEARVVPLAEPDLHEPHAAAPTAAPSPTAPPAPHGTAPAPPRPPRRPPSAAPPPPSCTGSPLTSQSQVHPNTSYCGGHATSRIVLAGGDTWTRGEVSGAVSSQQQGAVQCGNPCTLIDMNIHDNPGAFAGIYAQQGGVSGPFVVSGGRVTGSGSLGIGTSNSGQVTVSGVEIDHNGASANCGFEGGGFKSTSSGSRFTGNHVHDNNCVGVWYDINAANNEIDHNRVDNNALGGIFYEISQDASIHDNEVSGNGHGSGCGWLWNAGIGIASSFNIQVYGNSLSGNCNGVAGTQQNRTDSVPPAHLLENLSIHDNSIAGPGRTGVATDNGADLTTRNIVFANNSYSGGAVLCGFAC